MSAPPPEVPQITDRASELALGAIVHASHYLAADGEFMAAAIGEGTHADLVHAMLQPPEVHPEGRGMFPVLSGGGLDPLRAHTAARLEGLEAYALVATARVQTSESGPPQDAILVEVAVRDEPIAHVLMAIYRPKGDAEPFGLTGERGIIGTAANLFATAT